MTRSARSILIFGAYLAGMGAGLLAMPKVLLGTLGLPATDNLWPRVIGVLALVLAAYFVLAARAGLEAFFRWTIATRIGVSVAFAALVAAGIAPTPLLLLGAVDLAAALWTLAALRAGARADAAPARTAGKTRRVVSSSLLH